MAGKKVNLLTELEIRKHKSEGKDAYLPDGNGLALLCTAAGAKRWVLALRYKDPNTGKAKQTRCGLGNYPKVSLQEARRAAAMRRSEADSGKPTKNIGKNAEEPSVPIVFNELIDAWMANVLDAPNNKWAPNTVLARKSVIRLHIRPTLGEIPLKDIHPSVILELALQPLVRDGKVSTAHTAMEICGKLCRYANLHRWANILSVPDTLKGMLPPARRKHTATLTKPEEIGRFMLATDHHKGATQTKILLKLAPLVFTRPNELRRAKWEEVNWDEATWSIPEERMKIKRPHIVPLSTQAIALLKKLHGITGHAEYLFAGNYDKSRPIGVNTLNCALSQIGYGSKVLTGHGFRGMASTRLNERGYNPRLVELQLGHAVGTKIEAAYNHAEHLAERREMMQFWSDYLYGLKARAWEEARKELPTCPEPLPL